MALDRNKMRFQDGVVLTKEQDDVRQAEIRKKYSKVNIGMLFASMAGLVAGLNSPPPPRRKPPTSLDDLS